MSSVKRQSSGSLLNYFNGDGTSGKSKKQKKKNNKVERISQDWGCLVDRTLKAHYALDKRDLEWQIKATICHANIRRGRPFTVHYKSNLVDETDWSRPPGTGPFAVDSLRPGGEEYSGRQERQALPSVVVENLKFLLAHCCLGNEAINVESLSEEELYILCASFNHRHKWICFPDKYWFRLKDQRMRSEFTSLVERKLMTTYEQVLLGPVPNLTGEQLFRELVEILVPLHRNALERLYLRLTRKHATSRETQVGMIAKILQSLKPVRLSKQGIPVFEATSIERFVAAAKAVFSTVTTVVRLDEKLYTKLLQLHERFFLLHSISPAEAANVLRLKLRSIEFSLVSSNNALGRGEVDTYCYEHLSQLITLQDQLRVAVLSDSKELAFEATHKAANLCMDMKVGSCKEEGVLTEDEFIRARLLFSTVFQGVHLLERLKQYDLAIHYLTILLPKFNAKDFPLFHAKVVLRLAKDYEHLGTSSGVSKALELLETCIGKTGCVLDKTTHRNKLGGYGVVMIRALLRLSIPPRRWKVRVANLLPLNECKSVTITSASLSKRPRTSSVEQVVLQHYREKGWCGEHVENGTLLTLYGILLWDLLHGPLSTTTQTFTDLRPLELYGFWTKDRELALEQALSNVTAEAEKVLRASYNHNYGKYARGVNWKRNSLDELCHLVKVVGSSKIAFILRLLAQNYMAWCNGKLNSRHTMPFNLVIAGMPDLLLWNDSAVRFVEVKGPGKLKELSGWFAHERCVVGDTLSDRQRAWIDVFVSLQIDVEVCHVKKALAESSSKPPPKT